MADPSYKLFRSIMMGEVEEEDSPKWQLSDALFSNPSEDECRGEEEEELEYEEDEDEDAEEDENSEEDIDAEEKKPIIGESGSTAAKNMTTSENRIQRQCVICGKRILYLAHHLARHHKVRDKGRRLCFLYQSRQINPITRSRMPAYNRKPRDCIFPGCFAKALKRLDNHLVAVHKLKRGSAVFTQTLIRSRAGQQQPTDEENCIKKEIDGSNHWEDQDDVPLNAKVHLSTQATSSPSSPGAPDVMTADTAPPVASPLSASQCSTPPTLPLTVPIIPTLSSPSHSLLTSSAITAHVAPIIPAQPSTPVQSSTLRQPFTPAQSSTVAVKLSPQRLCSTPPVTNLSSISHSSLTSPAITANDIPTIPAQPSTNAQSSTLPQLFTPSQSSTDAVTPTPQRLSSPSPSPLAAPVNSSLQDLPPAAALYIQYLEERIAVLERVIQLNTLKKEDGSVLPAGGR